MKKISFFLFFSIIAFSARAQCTLQLDSVWLDSAASTCNHLVFKYQYSGGIPNSYYWTYGDGNACTCIHPKNVYNKNGSFDVWGKITDINGCKDSFRMSVNVNCKNPCDLSEIGIRSFDSLSYDCGEYEFNIFTSDNAKTIKLDFGDGDVSSSKFVVHKYKNKGIYNATLVIQDSIGCADTADLRIEVDCSLEPDPCDFVITSIDTTAVGTCKFRLFNIQSNKTVATTKWTYGDGDTLRNNSRFSGHMYKKDTGVFTMCVISTDSSGCKDTFCRLITIACPKTDISDVAINNLSFKVFPNPVTDILHISSPVVSRYILYDLTFKNIVEGDLAKGDNGIDLSQVKKGMYILVMSNEAGTNSYKIVRQ